MTDGNLTRLAAHEMAAGLRAGEFSSRELTAAHLDEAAAGNPALNAWLVIDDGGALAAADAADARLAAARAAGPAAVAALHPLCGVPVGLKDLVTVRGGQCTAGSRILGTDRSWRTAASPVSPPTRWPPAFGPGNSRRAS